MNSRILVFTAVSLSFLGFSASADAPKEYVLEIKDHVFTPATLEVPAGEKFTLRVKNLDASAEEFESHALNREKVIPAGKEGVIKLGPLKAGDYPFVGEFHEATAKGVLRVKAAEK